jgi:hypothetical protein
MKDPFTSDGIQGPSYHLYKLEVRYSLFKLLGISHDEVRKKLFYVFCRVKKIMVALNGFTMAMSRISS